MSRTGMNRAVSTFFGFIGLVLIALGFLRSQTLVSQTGMTDFRNRVVAARQAELGLNPYLFKWNPAYPETLLDPADDPSAKYTRMTSPPTTLWFQSFFAGFPYSTQKSANFVLNWLALFMIAGWIGSRLKAPFGAVLLATGIYAISALWQFHVERGQQYVYFTLFLTFAVFPPRAKLGSAFQALSVFFRPTAGLSIFTAFREKRPLRGILITAGIGAFLLVPVLVKYPFAWWLDYFASTHDWYQSLWGFRERVTPLSASLFPPAPEGDPTLLGVRYFAAPGSILYHFAMKSRWAPPYSLGLFLTGGITLFSGWKLWRGRAETLESFALRFFSAIYLADYFLPSPRSGYNAVLFFPALVLAVIELSKRKRGWTLYSAVAAALGLGFALEALFIPHSSPMLVEVCYLVAAGIALGRPITSRA